VGLDLIVGPANSGKVAELYRRYRAALDRGERALLIVPDARSIRRVERELLLKGSLIGGYVTTFDAVFERSLALCGRDAPLLAPGRRRLELARTLRAAELPTIAGSAAGARFADAFLRLADRLGSALVDPARFEAAAADDAAARDIAVLYRDWWLRLDELAAHDAPRRRIAACEALSMEVAAWDGTQLFVQGFEDLTVAQETAIRLIGDRAGAVLTLPYEPGRVAFAVVAPIVRRLAERAVVTELAPLPGGRPPALAALERRLFEDAGPAPGPATGDELVLLEAAGARAEADLVLQEVCRALRDGIAPDRIAVVTGGDPDDWPDLCAVLERSGAPVRVERRRTAGRTSFGFAVDRLLRFAWAEDARRGDLFGYLRSPWSGVPRRRVDFVEGRLRGRAIADPERVLEAAEEALGTKLTPVHDLRSGAPAAVLERALERMVVAGCTLTARPVRRDDRVDLAAARAMLEVVREVADASPAPRRDELRHLVSRARVAVREDPTGRVLVTDVRAVRGLDLDVVIVVGLEHARFGGGPGTETFLPEAVRPLLEAGEGAEAGDLGRHLLYVAVTRAARRVGIVRRIASDDGRPVEASPLQVELAAAAPGQPPSLRRGLADVTFSVEEAPTVRERVRAVCNLALHDRRRASRIAESDGTVRRLRRAERAFQRPTRVRSPEVLEALRRIDRFNVTSLEKFGDCSSWWFVERHLQPKDIDAAYDARLQGTIAHTALHRFYRQVPAAFGKDRLGPDDADRAEELVRELVAEAMQSQTLPPDTLRARVVARRVARDLTRFVRHEALHPSPLAATRFEVAFGGQSAAPGLKEGLVLGDFAVTGKIDRIDTDPAFSAHALVQDYKTGRTAHPANRLLAEGRLQIPLYVLAARDLLGLEPIGGLYRALGPGGSTRGMVVGGLDELPTGVSPADELDSDAMWEIVAGARQQAIDHVRRIRSGDVGHDPRGGSCPVYCPWSGVCRIPR
jgi:hypothetical protein